jgi:hypothetical protein
MDDFHLSRLRQPGRRSHFGGVGNSKATTAGSDFPYLINFNIGNSRLKKENTGVSLKDLQSQGENH